MWFHILCSYHFVRFTYCVGYVVSSYVMLQHVLSKCAEVGRDTRKLKLGRIINTGFKVFNTFYFRSPRLREDTWAKCHHWKPRARTKESCCDKGPQPAESGQGLLQHLQKGLPGTRDYDSLKGVKGNKCLLYLAIRFGVCLLKSPFPIP